MIWVHICKLICPAIPFFTRTWMFFADIISFLSLYIWTCIVFIHDWLIHVVYAKIYKHFATKWLDSRGCLFLHFCFPILHFSFQILCSHVMTWSQKFLHIWNEVLYRNPLLLLAQVTKSVSNWNARVIQFPVTVRFSKVNWRRRVRNGKNTCGHSSFMIKSSKNWEKYFQGFVVYSDAHVASNPGPTHP